MTKFLKRENAPSLHDLPDPALYYHADWYVIFSRGRPHWWDWFQKDGFHHVYAARFTRTGWIIYQPVMATTEVRHIPAVNRHDLLRILRQDEENTAIIRVSKWIPRQGFRVPHIITPWTCVEHIKALLGIRSPFILSPWQLYRHLKGEEDGKFRRRT